MFNFASDVLNRPAHYIDGEFRAVGRQGNKTLINPYTEAEFGSIGLGTIEDVDAAVAAARKARPGWAALSRAERAGWLQKLGTAIADKAELIAQLETACMGSPITFSRQAQAQLPAQMTGSYADFLAEDPHDELIGNSRVVMEPVGVVAAIAAWNYPLLLLMGKIAPAIATGCTVVAKPSEITPLTAMVVADILAEINFPRGVVNIVNGTGPQVGERLATHPDVAMVSFTGSTSVGRRVMEIAAPQVKRVALELGGKSATIILEDAPLEQAVRGAVRGCFINAGQTCIALTRLIVPEHMIADAADIAAQEAAQFVPGNPSDEATTLGPLAFAAHRDRVRDYIALGQEEAEMLCGGTDMPAGIEKGCFVQPTIFTNVSPLARIAQEEIFGPVLCLLAAKDEDSAVEIANGTQYGLNGAVWSSDIHHAARVARRLECGKVDINGGGFNMNAPAGGFKQSGIGRERGRYAMAEYQEIKALQFNDASQAAASKPE